MRRTLRKIVPAAVPIATLLLAPSAAHAVTWHLVLADQFNGSAVDTSKWTILDGSLGSAPYTCSAPRQASESGGALHLRFSYLATKPASCTNSPSHWTSATVYLSGSKFPAGLSNNARITLRARVTDVGGVAAHRILPMRWPRAGVVYAGEQDFCEGSELVGSCDTYLHYGSTDSTQISKSTSSIDRSVWHTYRAEQSGTTVRFFVDNLTTPVWTYYGNTTTVPQTIKQVVLQQECESSCPVGTSGSETIDIDWITVETG
jgi:hypothetical protein